MISNDATDGIERSVEEVIQFSRDDFGEFQKENPQMDFGEMTQSDLDDIFATVYDNVICKEIEHKSQAASTHYNKWFGKN